jgi:uncharacterized caspase-like protein
MISIKRAISRRTLLLGAVVLFGLVSAGIGANAALSKLTPDLSGAFRAAAEQRHSPASERPSRLALVIGNSSYPDASAPLDQPINDAEALSTALRNDGFDVEVAKDATRDDLIKAIDRLKQKVRPDSVVMFYFGGYAVESAGENFMIPVDASIWKERDVRHQGVSIDWALARIQEGRARAKLVVVDASRRNPYERRFRSYAHGLAPIDTGANALILSSAPAHKLIDDRRGPHSVLVTELIANLNSRASTADNVFNRTRVSVSRATGGEQVPTVSSSLIGDVSLGSGPPQVSERGS